MDNIKEKWEEFRTYKAPTKELNDKYHYRANGKTYDSEKIKYYISQVMPAGTGEGAAGDDFDAPIIDNSDELAPFHEQIEEAKQEVKEYNESKEEEVRKKPGNDVPGGRDDD